MASVGDYIWQGTRIFFSGWKQRLSATKYEGSADEICRQIVKDCWNGRYFMTSTGNFSQFWTRDFGWCVSSLLTLGYKDEVHRTLRYALNRFIKYRKITTTITPGGKPFDFPTMAVDSLPWLIHSIKVSGFSYYAHRKFLNRQVKKFFAQVVDPATGLVYSGKHFSSMKDFTIRDSSCYDNCMVAMLARDLSELKYLDNPFTKFDYPTLITQHFWNGSYFIDDLSKKEYVAGDPNLFPFVLGIISNREMQQNAFDALIEEGLDDPFPLKYTSSREQVQFIWQEFAMRDYESTAVWMHMGPLFVKAVATLDTGKAAQYKQKYKELIEKYGNFLEVFDSDGKPYSSWYYTCDRGMLWAANYLTL